MLTSKINFSQNESINDVLKTILYFDVFKYPITKLEIEKYSKLPSDEINTVLAELVEGNIIFFNDGFYSLNNENSIIEIRKKGNILAEKTLGKAKKTANFISQFPFIEGVFLSGSISKGFLKENDDVDYFIITSPERLWFARTLLILYKKIFLLNSKKYFCVNYFLSSDALEINEQNRFTATEFVTLVPMSGNGIYDKLKEKNTWVLDFFPRFSQNNENSKNIDKKFIGRTLETIFKGKLGTIADNFSMKITTKHQQRKFKKLAKKDFKVAFKSEKNVSKHHPRNHQKKVINKLNSNIEAFNKLHNLSIPLEK